MTTTMRIPHSRSATVARAPSSGPSLSLSAALGQQLSTLYAIAQRSDYVFGSPLGPFSHAGQHHYLPRFVYFGPHTSEGSPRLAFLAGIDSRDLRPTLALLHLVEELALKPTIGQSLHLAFYPLVDILGHLPPSPRRTLDEQSWIGSAEPEIDLLARESRLRNYHAFVRVESVVGDDAVTLRLRSSGAGGFGAPLVSTEDADPYPIRWEIEPRPASTAGPGSLGADLPISPLDLTLRVPAVWTPEFYRGAVSAILKRFIIHYRRLLAYGQHL